MTYSKPVIITVDGPSGSGKGTICRKLAEKLGFKLLDSGSLYRLTALSCEKNQLDANSETDAAGQAANLRVEFKIEGERTAIYLSGEDVTQAIRQERIGTGASIVAAHPKVRTALLQRQRDFAVSPGLVADGRDMGTVVFPKADLKIYLTASAEERAKRRFLQLQQSGMDADQNEILKDIQARDDRDMNRSVAPLVPAEDAVVLDSTSLNVAQVLDEVYALVRNKLGLTP